MAFTFISTSRLVTTVNAQGWKSIPLGARMAPSISS